MDWLAILVAGVLAAIGPVTAAYAVPASGLNLQFGHAGIPNFGPVAFMLVGAYGLAVTVEFGGPFWLGVLVGVAAGVLLGLLMGLPTLRLRADYFAITSIAFAEVIRILTRSTFAEPLTGGVFGIQVDRIVCADLTAVEPDLFPGVWVDIESWKIGAGNIDANVVAGSK